ncbi:hypothetical protein OJAV_G00039090 [Oryzias javanicus]|uniref:Uncharacterized protein n=1 Tax=Oryzias javanicus TaxID=123683 RepID=A0A3S2MRK5_ORYJA|nr:hypothetical protein OJAV_G00039090 [Oryzias javanicus]
MFPDQLRDEVGPPPSGTSPEHLSREDSRSSVSSGCGGEAAPLRALSGKEYVKHSKKWLLSIVWSWTRGHSRGTRGLGRAGDAPQPDVRETQSATYGHCGSKSRRWPAARRREEDPRREAAHPKTCFFCAPPFGDVEG